MKQAIVVRKDLKMGCGKISAQCCHASVRCYSNSTYGERINWIDEKKVILKVKSEEELFEIVDKCIEKDLNYMVIRDAGNTQVEAGTPTCVGIGPHDEETIDEIVGKLKLL